MPSQSDDHGGFGLALPFDSDDPEFTRGVEIGRLWEQFKQPEGFEQTIHAENAEMVLRIIEATRRRGRVDFTAYDEWMVLIVEEVGVPSGHSNGKRRWWQRQAPIDQEFILRRIGDQMQSEASRLAEWAREQGGGSATGLPYEVGNALVAVERCVTAWTDARAAEGRHR